jgi:hypothetical protein
MTEEKGQAMCDAVIREWKQRVTHGWPTVREQCAQSVAYMILKGSRLTGYGLNAAEDQLPRHISMASIPVQHHDAA